MTKLRAFWKLAFELAKTVGIVFVLCAATTIASAGTTTFTTLVSFDGTNGSGPAYMSLVQGPDGNFYGTTYAGGTSGLGTVFRITPAGNLITLNSLVFPDGADVYGGLVLGTDGNFYGTTYGGAQDGLGSAFQITTGGTLTLLVSFSGVNGAQAFGGMAQGTDGNFYGTTYLGGHGYGTVFSMTPAGDLTTLFNFAGGTNGFEPTGMMVLGTDGNFYGTTYAGGATGYGTVFKITPGKFTSLYSFCIPKDCPDGALPYAGLVQAVNGNFYGTTYSGGTHGYGTIFEITGAGVLTTLYSFCAERPCPDGAFPAGTLVQGNDGNFYGTTYGGGANDSGTIFQLTPAGGLTTLYSFCSQASCSDGAFPIGGLVQATNGTFYGTTNAGGTDDSGTVFSLSTGLRPFVETLPASGSAGASVSILGSNLTGATSVSFDGTAAAFTVISASEISATVPTGAATGSVAVTTPTQTLMSNKPFRVTPELSGFSPASGPVGTSVVLTGASLIHASAVAFGGVKATSFTVNSDTQVTATVPTGAKTGHITVTTGATAASSGTFTVTE